MPETKADNALNDRNVTILYGSQTGNAIDVSERISYQLKRRLFNVTLMSMDEYSIKCLPNEKIIIFVASTTGQGDTPDNMKKFWKCLLIKNIPNNWLVNVRFTVFCLGDSSYPKYNTVGRKLYQRILNLGGNVVVERGLGDDRHDFGYDSAFIPWLEKLNDKLVELYPIPKGYNIMNKNVVLKPKYNVEIINNSDVVSDTDMKDNEYLNGIYGIGSGKYEPCMAKLIKHARITPDDHWQDVRHLTIDITEFDQLSYKPGDVLLLHPTNSDESVKNICQLLKIKDYGKNIWIKMDEYKSYGIPKYLTIYELFKKYLDINGNPRRTFFERLIPFATNKLHKEKLEYFSKPEGQNALYEYNQMEMRTYIEVLHDFKSCLDKLSINYLISFIPKLKPRKFSISSCMEYYYDDSNCEYNKIPYIKNTKRKYIEITVALIEYKTPLKRQKMGICSQFIKSLPYIDSNQNNTIIQVPVWIENGSFRIRKDFLSTKAIFIGPGTGIAPFRSMSQYRYYLMNSLSMKNIEKCYVFFGNRNKDKDFFYENEWNKLSNDNGSILRLITAFSRDQNNKIYVTHKLLKYGELIWKWINEYKCYIFIAGSSLKMPNDVRNALITIIGKHGKMNKNDAQKYLNNLERTYKYQSETWS